VESAQPSHYFHTHRKFLWVLCISIITFLAMATIVRMSFFGTSTSAPHLAALLSQPQNQLPSFHATDSALS